MKPIISLLLLFTLIFSCKNESGELPQKPTANFVEENEPFETDEALELNTEALETAQKGNYEKAKTLFLKAYEIEPKNPSVMNNLAVCLMEMEDYDQSLTWFKKTLDADSGYLKAYVNMGLTYYRMKEYKKTLEVNQVIINSGNDQPHILGAAYLHNSMAYFDLKDCDNAKQNFEKAKELLIDTEEAQDMLQHVEASINECSLNSLMPDNK